MINKGTQTQIYNSKFEQLDEMEKFCESCIIPKLKQEIKKKQNSPI